MQKRGKALTEAIGLLFRGSSRRFPEVIVEGILLFEKEQCYECGLLMQELHMCFHKGKECVGGICMTCCQLNEYESYGARSCQWCKENTIQKKIWEWCNLCLKCWHMNY